MSKTTQPGGDPYLDVAHILSEPDSADVSSVFHVSHQFHGLVEHIPYQLDFLTYPLNYPGFPPLDPGSSRSREIPARSNPPMGEGTRPRPRP